MNVGETGEKVLTAKGRVTRDRIVAVAADLMFEGGVAGTGWEDVQRAAGVSASQLHHYFGDKQTLVRAVIAHQTRAVLGSQQPYLGRLDSMEALRAWRDLLVGIQRQLDCQGGCPLASLAGELAEAYPDTRSDLAAGFDQWEEAIREGLRAMHERGELRRGADPDRLATALLAAVQGGLVLTQVHRDAAPLEAALDAMLDHLSSLMVRRRGTPPQHPSGSADHALSAVARRCPGGRRPCACRSGPPLRLRSGPGRQPVRRKSG